MIILITLAAICGSLALLLILIVIYYSLKIRRQGFSIIREHIGYFSQITYLDSKSVTIAPSDQDRRNLELPSISLASREGSIVAGGRVIYHQNQITRSVISRSRKYSTRQQN